MVAKKVAPKDRPSPDRLILEAAVRDIENLQQQIRDAAGVSDRLHRRVDELELSLTRLDAKVHGYSGGSNCPKCGSKYRGAESAGKRSCGRGCGGRF